MKPDSPNSELETEELESDAIESEDSDASIADESGSESVKPLTGYELVSDMMNRQDAVISQLDDLNDRIESAIKRLSEARQLEKQAEELKAADAESSESMLKAA